MFLKKKNLVLRHFCRGKWSIWKRIRKRDGVRRCLIEFGRREANRNKCPGVGHLLRNNQDVCSLPSRSLAATMAMHRRERWPFKGYKCMPNGIRNRNLSTVRNGIVCGTLLPVARMPYACHPFEKGTMNGQRMINRSWRSDQKLEILVFFTKSIKCNYRYIKR